MQPPISAHLATPRRGDAHAAAGRSADRPRASRLDRLIAAVFGCAILAVLAIGAGLRPSPDGLGTHRQLGLPNCGWIASSNLPCPTCGMTTAVSNVARGNIVAALEAQPMGAIAALIASAVFWGCVHVALFGSRVGALAIRLLTPKALWIVGAIWAASWVYKILIMR